MNLIWIGFAILLLSSANGSRILFLLPFPARSHWMIIQNFAKELVNRGHEVTSIVNAPISNFKSPNYTEIIIDPPVNLSRYYSPSDVFQNDDANDFTKIWLYVVVASPASEHGLNNSNVQKIIHSKDLKFDLVVVQDIFSESWLMFAYKFDAPVISICTYGHPTFADQAMGMITPLSHIAHHILPNGDNMSYTERVYNVILSLYDWYIRTWYILPKQNELAKQYFSHLISEKGKPLPLVEDLYRNVSMFFVNTHKSTSRPRPVMPGIINIGGSHIKPPKPLPNDLREFFDNSEHGVIVFSLGTFVETSKMPTEKISIILEVLGKLKQNVLWKFEDESLKNVPSNVKIQKWLPQSDALAHPNVVLFIGHGGMSGTFEGIARGVPMLFIPFYADQSRNAQKCVDAGHALLLPFKQLTVELFSERLNKLLTDNSYSKRAKEIARIFNDNLVSPMDEAMFWMEYVIRSGNGAKHLKSNAVYMCWFSYLLLDIILAPFAVIFVTYFLLKWLLKR